MTIKKEKMGFACLRKTPRKDVICIICFILFFSLHGCSKNSPRKEFFGSFYANDSGISHGGFEWGGEYDATLLINGTKGDLILEFSIGIGDYLTKHEFTVSDFSEAGGSLSFKINGKPILLVFVENDRIWNGQYNNHYIGNNSDDASERLGLLPVEVFTGLKAHYYVELRLENTQSSSRFLSLNCS